MQLEPLVSKGFHEKNISKFALDECYPYTTLSKGPNYQVSLIKTDTALISPCLSIAETGIKTITINNFLFLRLRKLVYCRRYSMKKIFPIRVGNHSLHPLPSTYFYCFDALLTPSRKLTTTSKYCLQMSLYL